MVDKRDVLISIQPQYVEKILNGTKRYEFRKIAPAKTAVRDFYIYTSAPVQRIVARFPTTEIHAGSPEAIWAKCGEHSGGSSEGFFEYFAGREKAYAIEIRGLETFDEPINPYKSNKKFWPPQSYCFLNEGILS
ncbi:hypothetical protein [Methanocella sp. MCL-LM]|uniref:hypothetical protein n=1 Tax=Methanocella sp. MCL-LM TaxID=3412035 RepID=UPI003C796D8C